MARTFTSVFCIQLFTVIITHSEGIPLNLRCSSRSTLSTFSRSSGSPFLAAEPHLSFLPTNFLPPILDEDSEEIPELIEKTPKTIVILHKVHKNYDRDVEIVITTKERRESNEDSSESNESFEDPHEGIENRDYDKSLTVDQPVHSEEITKYVNDSEENRNHTTKATEDKEKTMEIERKDVEDFGLVDSNE